MHLVMQNWLTELSRQSYSICKEVLIILLPFLLAEARTALGKAHSGMKESQKLFSLEFRKIKKKNK